MCGHLSTRTKSGSIRQAGNERGGDGRCNTRSGEPWADKINTGLKCTTIMYQRDLRISVLWLLCGYPLQDFPSEKSVRDSSESTLSLTTKALVCSASPVCLSAKLYCTHCTIMVYSCLHSIILFAQTCRFVYVCVTSRDGIKLER